MTILENIDIDINIDKAVLENIDIDKAIFENIDIDKDILENIDINIDIDKDILENIDIDIDKGIFQNIDIDKISYRLGFGISNTPTPEYLLDAKYHSQIPTSFHIFGEQYCAQ